MAKLLSSRHGMFPAKGVTVLADKQAKLPAPLRIGGRVVWSVAEIKLWIRAACPPRKEWDLRKAAMEGKA